MWHISLITLSLLHTSRSVAGASLLFLILRKTKKEQDDSADDEEKPVVKKAEPDSEGSDAEMGDALANSKKGETAQELVRGVRYKLESLGYVLFHILPKSQCRFVTRYLGSFFPIDTIP